MKEWYYFFRTHKTNRLIQDSIFDQFVTLFENSPEPEREGAFILTEVIPDGIYYYFSPEAVKIAHSIIAEHEAVECDNPIENEADRKNYQFFVGDEIIFSADFDVFNKTFNIRSQL